MMLLHTLLADGMGRQMKMRTGEVEMVLQHVGLETELVSRQESHYAQSGLLFACSPLYFAFSAYDF